MTDIHLPPASTDAHARAALLIPWAVNGTLQGEAAAQLRAHLESCGDCRRDYDAQLRLREALQPRDSLVFAAEPSLQKLLARIGASEAAVPGAARADAALLELTAPQAGISRPGAVRPAAAHAGLGHAVRWLAAAMLVEALVLGGGWTWYAQRARPAYITLAAPDPSASQGPRVRVVFRPGLQVGALGEILRSSGAHVIDGPGDANVYTLGFTQAGLPPEVLELRVAALRANAGVLFAEPVGGGPPR